jgi:hypothetical protein
LHIQFHSARGKGTNDIENSLKRKLLDVVAGSAAANDNRIIQHFDLQHLNPSTGSFHDLVLDSLIQPLGRWLAVLSFGHSDVQWLLRLVVIRFNNYLPERQQAAVERARGVAIRACRIATFTTVVVLAIWTP